MLDRFPAADGAHQLNTEAPPANSGASNPRKVRTMFELITKHLTKIEKDVHDLRAHLDERLDRNHERENAMNAQIAAAIAAISATKDLVAADRAATDLLAGEVAAVGTKITA